MGKRTLLIVSFGVWVCSLVFAVHPAGGAEKSDTLANKHFKQGRAAHDRGDYAQAVEHFEQACSLSSSFFHYYSWLGDSYIKKYDQEKDSGEENLEDLKNAVSAFKESFKKNKGPVTHFDLGNATIRYAIKRAKAVEETSVEGTPSGDVGEDTLAAIWKEAEDGLATIWGAILAQENKDAWTDPISDDLEIYLSRYIAHCFTVAPHARAPDVYISVITNACERGKKSKDPKWFEDVLKTIRFDGRNIRCAILRDEGMKLGSEDLDKAFEKLQAAIKIAKADNSKAFLYLEMAFFAYSKDLDQAKVYAKKAYDLYKSDRTKDYYGSILLSLATMKLNDAKPEEALDYALPATRFQWSDYAEALKLLAETYMRSNIEGALEKACEAARKAYEEDKEKYWKDLRDILELRGDFHEVRRLEEKHGRSSE